MNDTIVNALNDQMRKEFQAAFLYLAFSVDLKEYGLYGAAHWMREQYREECNHAFKILNYLEDRDAKVHVPSIQAPEYQWSNPVELFEQALQHEEGITASIHALVKLSRQEDDPATELMLQYFVNEQVEEEGSVRSILQELRLCGGHIGAIMGVDARLGKRPEVQNSDWA